MTVDFTKWANGDMSDQDAKDNFISYFNQHYKPLLNKLADNPYQKIEMSEKDKTLLSHLRDDLTEIFRGGEA